MPQVGRLDWFIMDGWGHFWGDPVFLEKIDPTNENAASAGHTTNPMFMRNILKTQAMYGSTLVFDVRGDAVRTVVGDEIGEPVSVHDLVGLMWS